MANAVPIDTLPGQGTAPATATQQSGGGAVPAVLSQLLDLSRTQNEAMQPLIKEALTPVGVPSAGTSPGLAVANSNTSFTPGALIDKPTVGARSTRDKGIANTIIGLTNLVGQYKAKTAQNKQRVLAVDLERVMQAQNGAAQAQQVLNSDPSNKDAQAALKRNTDIVNAMMSDDKRRKSFEKALDINFTDPSQNNSPEHGALKQATNSYAEQLAAKMPTQQAPNAQAQERLKFAAAQNAATNKLIETITPVILKEQGATERTTQTNYTKEQIAAAEVAGRNQVAKTNLIGKLQAINTASQTRLKVAGIQADAAMARLNTLDAARMKLLTQKDTDIATQSKLVLGMITGQNNYISKVQAQKNHLDLLHVNKKIDDGTYNKQSAYLDGQLKSAQDKIQAMQQFNTVIASQQMGANANGNSTTSTNASTEQPADNPTVGETADTDNDPDNPEPYDVLKK